ncbi:hypothetical protein FRC07_013543, partial [Ceratobasidium sp. 392]
MLHRDMPFGLARQRGHAEPFFDGQPAGFATPTHSRQPTSPKVSRICTSNISQEQPDAQGALPEDVIVIILGHLNVRELMVVRRCSKWFRKLTQNRQLWINFISHPYFPAPAFTSRTDTPSHHALELIVRRQFELSRTWSPKGTASPIPIRRSYRLSMPNNESLTAMSSMDSWVAVASDLGGVYVCAPFASGDERRVKWIRMLSVPVEINKLSVAVWHVFGCDYVAVMWAGRLSVALEFQCGLIFAAADDLIAAQDRTQGRVALSTSDFVSSSTMQLRNSASEIMNIALGDRYCAVVDAAHIIQ